MQIKQAHLVPNSAGRKRNKSTVYPVMPAVTNQSTLIPSCSQRSEQKCTVVSFPAGQIAPCVHGLLCSYSVTYSKPSVSDDDVNSVCVEQGSTAVA